MRCDRFQRDDLEAAPDVTINALADSAREEEHPLEPTVLRYAISACRAIVRRIDRGWRSAGIACALLTTLCCCAPTEQTAFHGQDALRIPTRVLPVGHAAHVVRVPRWSRDADPPPSTLEDNVETMVTGDGIVAFASKGRFCGFVEADGSQAWCARGGTVPAFAGGIIAYRRSDGGIDAVEALTGRHRWTYIAPGNGDQAVWPAPRGFILAPVGTAPGADHSVGEVAASGAFLWSADRRGHLEPPIIAGRYALQVEIGSGATIFGKLHVYKLGRGGESVATILHADAVLDVRPSSVVVRGDQMAQVDPFLTDDVWVADIPSGRITQRFTYAPDYTSNERAFTAGRLAQKQAVRVEGDQVYIAVGPTIYRYRLASPDAQRPLRVVSNGTLLAGPYHGTIYVWRPGGVWSYRPHAQYIEARLVAPSHAPAALVKFFEHSAYVGFTDGHIVAFSVEDGATEMNAKGCAPKRLVISTDRVYVLCSGAVSRVLAFDRSAVAGERRHPPKRRVGPAVAVSMPSGLAPPAQRGAFGQHTARERRASEP